MEIWDLYDINRLPTGETMIRGEKIKENRYHLAVHICIFNKQGEMLIQHRQPFKSGWSDLWDITVVLLLVEIQVRLPPNERS